MSVDVPIIGDHGDIKEGGDSIVELIIGEMIDEVTTMDTGQGEANDPAQAKGSHTVEVLGHSMVDMALEVAATLVSTLAIGINRCSMNKDTPEDNPGDETETLEALARDREGDANIADRQNIKLCADNMGEDGLIKIVPLLKDDKFMDE